MLLRSSLSSHIQDVLPQDTGFIKISNKLYGKVESVNPGGSIKDRPVKYILDNAEKHQLINNINHTNEQANKQHNQTT